MDGERERESGPTMIRVLSSHISALQLEPLNHIACNGVPRRSQISRVIHSFSGMIECVSIKAGLLFYFALDYNVENKWTHTSSSATTPRRTTQLCRRASRGAKRRSPHFATPNGVSPCLGAPSRRRVLGRLPSWLAVRGHCPLLACACSFGRWQRSRVQAKSEYTHTPFSFSPQTFLKRGASLVTITG